MKCVVLVALALPTLALARPASLPTCKPGKGTPIFEARWHSGKVKVITKLFASGEWQRTPYGHDGKARRSTKGCVVTEVDKIRTALKAAKWKKMIAQDQCLGVDASSTELYTFGVKRFVEKTCGTYSLDSTSEQAVALIGDRIPDGFANPITPEDIVQP